MSKESRLSIRIGFDELESIKLAAKQADVTVADYCLTAIRKQLGSEIKGLDSISLNERLKAVEKELYDMKIRLDAA